MDFGDLSDNPFTAHLNRRCAKRRAVASALKLLILVAVCLGLTVVAGNQCQRWYVARLANDFDSLTSDQKEQRLIQFAAFGRFGIDPLVRAMGDKDLAIARSAYDLLRQAQNDWTVLSRRELDERHTALVNSLKSVAVRLPDDRTGWGTSLLQQTLLTTIERRDEGSRTLYRSATGAIEMLSLSERAGPSILSDEPLDPLAPRRLVVRSKPLPVSSAQPLDQWTDWPPPRETKATIASSALAIVTEAKLVDDRDRTSTPVDGRLKEAEIAPADLPSVYKSTGARLQPVHEDEPVILRDLSGTERSASPSTAIRSVTHLVDSPLETFDDKSVMHWLASPHQAVRDKAKLELIGRGYDGTELAIATHLASADVASRMELLDSIARSDTIDPRPWLLMMLDDDSRDVKLRVISVLATMSDPEINQRLRKHLVSESDPRVAARIRRVLNLR